MLGKVAIENSIESKARRSRQEEKLVKCGTRKMTRGDWSWSATNICYLLLAQPPENILKNDNLEFEISSCGEKMA